MTGDDLFRLEHNQPAIGATDVFDSVGGDRRLYARGAGDGTAFDRRASGKQVAHGAVRQVVDRGVRVRVGQVFLAWRLSHLDDAVLVVLRDYLVDVR